MKVDQEIDKLKTNIFSADWDKVEESVNRLFEIGGEENFDYLIGLLEKQNSLIRNAVARAFRANKFNEGLDSLLKAIGKVENRNERGTMVYALQNLNCSKKLKELFDILFSAPKNWEVQSDILTVLEEQEFEFSTTDLKEIQNKWSKIKEDWNEANGIDIDNLKEYEIDKELVQDFVEGYVSYLKTEKN